MTSAQRSEMTSAQRHTQAPPADMRESLVSRQVRIPFPAKILECDSARRFFQVDVRSRIRGMSRKELSEMTHGGDLPSGLGIGCILNLYWPGTIATGSDGQLQILYQDGSITDYAPEQWIRRHLITGRTCATCLHSLESEAVIQVLDCGHSVHKECLVEVHAPGSCTICNRFIDGSNQLVDGSIVGNNTEVEPTAWSPPHSYTLFTTPDPPGHAYPQGQKSSEEEYAADTQLVHQLVQVATCSLQQHAETYQTPEQAQDKPAVAGCAEQDPRKNNQALDNTPQLDQAEDKAATDDLTQSAQADAAHSQEDVALQSTYKVCTPEQNPARPNKIKIKVTRTMTSPEHSVVDQFPSLSVHLAKSKMADAFPNVPTFAEVEQAAKVIKSSQYTVEELIAIRSDPRCAEPPVGKPAEVRQRTEEHKCSSVCTEAKHAAGDSHIPSPEQPDAVSPCAVAPAAIEKDPAIDHPVDTQCTTAGANISNQAHSESALQLQHHGDGFTCPEPGVGSIPGQAFSSPNVTGIRVHNGNTLPLLVRPEQEQPAYSPVFGTWVPGTWPSPGDQQHQRVYSSNWNYTRATGTTLENEQWRYTPAIEYHTTPFQEIQPSGQLTTISYDMSHFGALMPQPEAGGQGEFSIQHNGDPLLHRRWQRWRERRLHQDMYIYGQVGQEHRYSYTAWQMHEQQAQQDHEVQLQDRLQHEVQEPQDLRQATDHSTDTPWYQQTLCKQQKSAGRETANSAMSDSAKQMTLSNHASDSAFTSVRRRRVRVKLPRQSTLPGGDLGPTSQGVNITPVAAKVQHTIEDAQRSSEVTNLQATGTRQLKRKPLRDDSEVSVPTGKAAKPSVGPDCQQKPMKHFVLIDDQIDLQMPSHTTGNDASGMATLAAAADLHLTLGKDADLNVLATAEAIKITDKTNVTPAGASWGTEAVNEKPINVASETTVAAASESTISEKPTAVASETTVAASGATIAAPGATIDNTHTQASNPPAAVSTEECGASLDDAVGSLLNQLGLAHHARAFAAEEIDMGALLLLNHSDMLELGVVEGVEQDKLIAAMNQLACSLTENQHTEPDKPAKASLNTAMRGIVKQLKQKSESSMLTQLTQHKVFGVGNIVWALSPTDGLYYPAQITRITEKRQRLSHGKKIARIKVYTVYYLENWSNDDIRYFDELTEKALVRWEDGKRDGFQTICSAQTKKTIAQNTKFADRMLAGKEEPIDFEQFVVLDLPVQAKKHQPSPHPSKKSTMEPPAKKQTQNHGSVKSQKAKGPLLREKRSAAGSTKISCWKYKLWKDQLLRNNSTS